MWGCPQKIGYLAYSILATWRMAKALHLSYYCIYGCPMVQKDVSPATPRAKATRRSTHVHQRRRMEMDPSKFDVFTKALATATSRRQALKAIGATVGGILGLGGAGTALAKCAGIGAKCSQSSQCCLGYCNPSTFTCSCPSGTVPCGGTCVSNVCPDGQVFNTSTCQCVCPTGLTECSGTCTNTSSDPNNCGSCGNHCPPDAACVNGTCQCSLGTTMCNGICTNTSTDVNNCGTCGHACLANEICVGGVCVCPTVTCPSRGGTVVCCPPCTPPKRAICGKIGCVCA